MARAPSRARQNQISTKRLIFLDCAPEEQEGAGESAKMSGI